jgi:hypothetical protein
MRRIRRLVLALAVAVVLGATPAVAYTDACWGQATAAFAQLGEMGPHASQQENPREGLANLAKRLYEEEEVLDAPTLQALGAFLVSIDPNLTIDACMD